MPPTEPVKPAEVKPTVDPTKPAPADASKQDAKPAVNTAPASGQDVARDDNADRGERPKDDIGAVVEPTAEEKKATDERKKANEKRVKDEIHALVQQYTLIQLGQLAQGEKVPIPAGANSVAIATAIVEQREALRRTGHAAVTGVPTVN